MLRPRSAIRENVVNEATQGAEESLPAATASPSLMRVTNRATNSASGSGLNQLNQQRNAFRMEIRSRFLNRQQLLEKAREQFRAQLQNIQDERKRQIISRIEQNLNNLNKKIVDQLSLRLERLESLLAKINSRAKKMEDEGLVVTEALAKIETAQANIGDIREILSQQAEKVYVPQIVSESGLGIAAGRSYQELRGDIKVINDKLVAVKKEMANILHLLAQIKGGGNQ